MTDTAAEKFYPRCPECGSTNIAMDAVARWDFDAQAWALSSLLEFVACDGCGNEEFEPENTPVA